MTDSKTTKDVLPEADLSEAFGASVAGALGGSRRRRRPPAAAEDTSNGTQAPAEAPPAAPAPERAPEPAPRLPEAAPTEAPPQPPAGGVPPQARSQPPAPRGAVNFDIPDLGDLGKSLTQCTVMVRREVRDRIEAYRLQCKMAGKEPTNAVIVRRAFLAARKADSFAVLLGALRDRETSAEAEDEDPDGLLGEAPARRTERGRVKDKVQQAFRPTHHEQAVYDAFAAGYGFPNRADFIDAVLDAFLPPLPDGDEPRRGRRRP